MIWGIYGAGRRALVMVAAVGAIMVASQFPGQGGGVGSALAAPKIGLPVAKDCFAEPQIVAAAKVEGRFFPVQPTQVPIWLQALSATDEASVPDGDDLLVFIAAVPHGSPDDILPPGSGNVFVMQDGCLVWHQELRRERVLDLIDQVDRLRAGGQGTATPDSAEDAPAG